MHLLFLISSDHKYNAIYNNTVKASHSRISSKWGSSNNFFENNTVINCVSYCYYFLNVTKINLTGNNATNGLVGFYLQMERGNCINNAAFNSSQNGFYSDINDSAFINNTAASNGSFNSLLTLGINFTNNTAFNNSYAGSFLEFKLQ